MGNIFGRGRATQLIVNDADFQTFATQPERCVQKIDVIGAEHPRRPYDRLIGVRGAHRVLAVELRLAKYAQRIRRIGFDIGIGLGAIEDLVG